MIRRTQLFLSILLVFCFYFPRAQAENAAQPGARVLMDAHNCYPYYEWWSDRIDRALKAGVPLAIEQDLYWYTDPATGKSWSVVAHGAPLSGKEPTLDSYFFDRGAACGAGSARGQSWRLADHYSEPRR